MNDKKQYRVTIPDSIYQEVEEVAKNSNRPAKDVVRAFLLLGLLATRENLYVLEGKSFQQVIIPELR